MNRVIITVVGKDTVGIIAGICTYLAEHNINILDISQEIRRRDHNEVRDQGRAHADTWYS